MEMQGLSTSEAHERLTTYGRNILFRRQTVSFWGIARHEVTEPMILLLLVVGIFYSLWGRIGDAFTTFAVICLLVLAEVYNEFRAIKAIASLEKVAEPRARLKRDGELAEIEREEVVPGDVLVSGYRSSHAVWENRRNPSNNKATENSSTTRHEIPRW